MIKYICNKCAKEEEHISLYDFNSWAFDGQLCPKCYKKYQAKKMALRKEYKKEIAKIDKEFNLEI